MNMSENDAPPVEWSYAQEQRFRCIESIFRFMQAFMLVFLIISFGLYVIFFGIDITKYSNNLIQLFFVIVLDVLALFFIGLGVRGMALEIFPLAVTFGVAFVFIATGHCVTLLYRHVGLSICNIVLDALLVVLSICFSILLYRFGNMKPKDYDQRLQDAYGKKIYVFDEAGGLVLVSASMDNNQSKTLPTKPFTPACCQQN